MTLTIRFPYTDNDQFLLLDVEHHKLINDKNRCNQRLTNHSFILKTKGYGTITVDGIAYHTNRHESLIVHAPKRSILAIACKESFEYYKLSYHIRPISARIIEPPIYILKPNNTLLLYEKVDQLFNSFHSKKADTFQSIGLFYIFLANIRKELHAEEEVKPILDVADQVIEWIEYRYNEQVTLEGLADTFKYSVQHLSRLVKNRTGMSPIQYLIHLRMEKAKVILENTDAKLNEIAKRTGYNDLFYFSSQFKKNIGMSPSKYRQHYTQREELINRKFKNHIPKVSPSRYNIIEIDYQLRNDLLFMIKRFGFKPYLLGLVFFLFVLQACGNEGTGRMDDEESSGEEVVEKAEENDLFPRTVEDQAGNEVVIEEQPEDIAVTHFGHVEFLFALGITPVAGVYLEILKEWDIFDSYKEELETIEDIGNANAIDMEKLVGLEPELIIHYTGQAGQDVETDQFSQIAPTGQPHPDGNWQERLELYAELTGKDEEVGDLIEGLEAEIAETRDLLDYNSEDTVFIVIDSDLWAFNPESAEHIYHEENGLGLNAPEDIQEQGDLGKISLESLVDKNPDYLLVMMDNEEGYEEVLDMLNDYDAWLTTNASHNDQVHYINRSAQSGGPLSITYTLNQMKEIFGEK